MWPLRSVQGKMLRKVVDKGRSKITVDFIYPYAPLKLNILNKIIYISFYIIYS